MGHGHHILGGAEPWQIGAAVTYGADILHGAIHGAATMPYLLGRAVLAMFCAGLFAVSLRNIQHRWIA